MSSSDRACSVGCSTISKSSARIWRATAGNSAVRTTVGFCGISRSLWPFRHQPAEDEQRTTDEKKPDLECDVVLEEADHQSNRQHDHAGELQESSDQNRHRATMARRSSSNTLT